MSCIIGRAAVLPRPPSCSNLSRPDLIWFLFVFPPPFILPSSVCSAPPPPKSPSPPLSLLCFACFSFELRSQTKKILQLRGHACWCTQAQKSSFDKNNNRVWASTCDDHRTPPRPHPVPCRAASTILSNTFIHQIRETPTCHDMHVISKLQNGSPNHIIHLSEINLCVVSLYQWTIAAMLCGPQRKPQRGSYLHCDQCY